MPTLLTTKGALGQ
ncbi:hypothetical protein Tco_0929713, partial [Tanacetum coccineum]